MHLVCPACSREVTGQDVNIQAAVARCPHCFAVFSFSGAKVIGPSALMKIPRPQSPQPPHITIDDIGRDLTLWWSWRHWGLLPVAGFCLFWNGFLVMWYSIILWQILDPQAPVQGDGPLWLMAVFPVLHVAVGVFLGYATLSGLFNSTTIEVSGGLLSVRHGPIPFYGNVELDTKSITQLFCSPSSPATTGTAFQQQHGGTYDLVALLSDNSKAVVVSGQTDPSYVWYLEQLLEKKLKIEDERVPTEYVG